MKEWRTEIDKLRKVDEEEENDVRERITKLEEEKCDMVAEENREKVVNNFKLANPGGLCHTNGM